MAEGDVEMIGFDYGLKGLVINDEVFCCWLVKPFIAKEIR